MDSGAGEPTREGRANELIEEARAAMSDAYAPYSSYHVGAAILVGDGRVFRGVNVENASYSLSICAERVAVSSAVAAGARRFEMLALACSGAEPCTPCGACLQFLAEFAPDLEIVTTGTGGRIVSRSLAQLLPARFTL